MNISSWLKLVIAIAVSELAGVIGSLFTIPAIPTWYATLVLPAFAPPSWIFAPVWTILFALMGVAAFLIWNEGLARRRVRTTLSIFAVQLVLNTLWSVIFFGFHNPAGALIEIVLLWLAILATVAAFCKVSKGAAYLLLPYVLWVSFAAYLNYAIWMLN
ncbi:MAG: TspO/MBR family protein [bacterium]